MARIVHSRVRPWMITLAVVIVVIIVAAFNVKVVSPTEAKNADKSDKFDPADFAKTHYASQIVPSIQKNAIPLAQLETDLAGGAKESEYGHTSGAASAYAFPVTFTAVAGKPVGAILPVTVEGVDKEITVQVQVGPALNGTALRDVTGTISFNQFTNQLDYQQAATELNNQVRSTVLKSVDVASLAGKTITVTGAFLRVNPQLVSVVPISLEVAP